MLAYLGLDATKSKHRNSSLENVCKLNLEIQEMSIKLVEQIIKVYKMPHKCHHKYWTQKRSF